MGLRIRLVSLHVYSGPQYDTKVDTGQSPLPEPGPLRPPCWVSPRLVLQDVLMI